MTSQPFGTPDLYFDSCSGFDQGRLALAAAALLIAGVKGVGELTARLALLAQRSNVAEAYSAHPPVTLVTVDYQAVGALITVELACGLTSRCRACSSKV